MRQLTDKTMELSIIPSSPNLFETPKQKRVPKSKLKLEMDANFFQPPTSTPASQSSCRDLPIQPEEVYADSIGLRAKLRRRDTVKEKTVSPVETIAPTTPKLYFLTPSPSTSDIKEEQKRVDRLWRRTKKNVEKGLQEFPLDEHEVPVEENPAARFNSLFQEFSDKVLGEGQFGKVCSGIHRKNGRKLAIKNIPKDARTNSAHMLKSEVAILQGLNHHAIVRLECLFETKEKISVVMEGMQGDMYSLLEIKDRLSERLTKFIVIQVLSAIQHLHALGIVHCDVKPENILLSDFDSNLPQAKLCDFGFARFLEEGQLCNAIVGTPAYSPPEILNQSGFNKSSDIWSLGAVAFVSLSGTFPFKEGEAITSKHVRPNLLFRSARWKKLSHEAVHFVYSLMQIQMDLRLSAEDTMKHDWLMDRQLHEDLTELEKEMGIYVEEQKENEEQMVGPEPQETSSMEVVEAEPKAFVPVEEVLNEIVAEEIGEVEEDSAEVFAPSKSVRERGQSKKPTRALKASVSMKQVLTSLLISKPTATRQNARKKEVLDETLAEEQLQEEEELPGVSDPTPKQSGGGEGKSKTLMRTTNRTSPTDPRKCAVVTSSSMTPKNPLPTSSNNSISGSAGTKGGKPDETPEVDELEEEDDKENTNGAFNNLSLVKETMSQPENTTSNSAEAPASKHELPSTLVVSKHPATRQNARPVLQMAKSMANSTLQPSTSKSSPKPASRKRNRQDKPSEGQTRVRKPRDAGQFFEGLNRERLRLAHPKLENAKLRQLLRDEWRALEDKEEYVRMAADDKKRYFEEMGLEIPTLQQLALAKRRKVEVVAAVEIPLELAAVAEKVEEIEQEHESAASELWKDENFRRLAAEHSNLNWRQFKNQLHAEWLAVEDKTKWMVLAVGGVRSSGRERKPIQRLGVEEEWGEVAQTTHRTKPKRPVNAYTFWLREKSRAREAEGNAWNANSIKNEWRSLKDKQKWEQMARQDKERFTQESTAYRNGA